MLCAALAVGVASYSYFWAPENKRTLTAYTSYILLVVTVAILVVSTGGLSSPFIALWMVATIFAGIFGNTTIIGLFILFNVYAAYLLTSDTLSRDDFQTLLMAGELPVIISYILWHSKARGDKSKDRAYYDLANELNQVSNKAEVVINAIGDGVIAIDNQGVIELINPAAQRIVGWGKQDAIGLDYKSVLQLLGKDGHELTKTTDPVFEVLATNQQKRAKDLLLQTNSGKRISVSVVASPTGPMGSGAIIVFRDITKESAEEHEQAEFISTASHEMRTPVASIEGYLGLTLNPQTATIDERAREFIMKAHESAQHLGRLFQDLLDVTKADDGRLSNNPKVINLVEFTQEIVEALKPKAAEKNLRIFFKPVTTNGAEGAGLPSLTPVFYSHIDADHLREVLSNLVENAIKYTPAGEVTVDINGDNSHIIVSISDSGIGIPAEDIPHLFQKFYRVDNTDTREIGGTGLGLYLCRKLIEAMNGRIWVESEYKHGSTFFVEIPRITHEEANRLIEASVAENNIVEERTYASKGNEKAVILNHGKKSVALTSDPTAGTEASTLMDSAPAPTPAAPQPVSQPAVSTPQQTPAQAPQQTQPPVQPPAPAPTATQTQTQAQPLPQPNPSAQPTPSGPSPLITPLNPAQTRPVTERPAQAPPPRIILTPPSQAAPPVQPPAPTPQPVMQPSAPQPTPPLTTPLVQPSFTTASSQPTPPAQAPPIAQQPPQTPQ